jgi:RNA polymerase sigma factor (sigma-70 family)
MDTTGGPAGVVVHVVEDHPACRDIVAGLLRTRGYGVEAYPSANGLLEASPSLEAGCVLADLHLPDLSGLQLLELLSDRPRPVPVVLMTGDGDVKTCAAAMKAGAVDYLTKPVQEDELYAAIEEAVACQEAAAERLRCRQRLQERYERLTPRERQVFVRVTEGLLNKQIASQLGATVRTIKAHRRRVMEKLGAESLAELVRLAVQLGDIVHEAKGESGHVCTKVQ